MNLAAQAVLDHLSLEKVQEDSFVTVHQNEGSRQVFGGQLMAQSLVAASTSVPSEKKLVSYQSIFTAPADIAKSIHYKVKSLHEGKSFSLRQVVAQQHNKLCFQATVSFQSIDEGLEFHQSMPSVPTPYECADLPEMVAAYQKHFPDHLGKVDAAASLPPQAVDMRFVDINRFLAPSTDSVGQFIWVRFDADLGGDHERHKQVLAYVSDQTIAHVATAPHGLGGVNPKLRLVSLDHSLWFHRPFAADDWLLLARQCESTSAGRALVTGQIFDQAGTLVASLAQQALVRLVS